MISRFTRLGNAMAGATEYLDSIRAKHLRKRSSAPEVSDWVDFRNVDLIVTTYLAFAGAILLTGYLVSEFGKLDDVRWWFTSLFGCFLVGSTAAIIYRTRHAKKSRSELGPRESWRKQITAEFFSAPILAFVSIFLVVVWILAQIYHILICSLLGPTNWDSMTYILPRIAAYLQRGSLEYFESNYIAQTVHFKNATILQIFAFLTTGRSENAIQFVALISSWITTFSVFGTGLLLVRRVFPALAAAAILGGTTNFMMIAVTPQLDMPTTAFFSMALYGLCRFSRKNREWRWIIFAAAAAGMGCGSKATMLLLVPSLGLVYFVVSRPWQGPAKAVAYGFLFPFFSGVFALAIFSLPAGYWENWSRYGHIMGPEGWREDHVMPDLPMPELLEEGTRNAIRYVVHFIGLDGLEYSPKTAEFQYSLRKPILNLSKGFGLDLEEQGHGRQPFNPKALWTPNEDFSFPGLAFLLILLPGSLCAIWRVRNRPLVFALIGAALFYFLAQSFLSKYDPWRGRTFVNLAVILAPLSACLFLPAVRYATMKSLLLTALCLGIGYISLNACLFRYSSPLYQKHGSIGVDGILFRERGRSWELTRSNPRFKDRYDKIDSLLPPEATVVFLDVGPAYQYGYYGEKLRRTVLFRYDIESIPKGAYLLFHEDKIPLEENDIRIDAPGKDPHHDGSLFLRPPG